MAEKIAAFLLALACCGGALGQRNFSATLVLAPGMDTAKTDIYYDDAKSMTSVDRRGFHGDTIDIRGTYYGLYASVEVRYPRPGTLLLYDRSFFVGQQPARITLLPADSTHELLRNYRLDGAKDFLEDDQRMAASCADESVALKAALKKIGPDRNSLDSAAFATINHIDSLIFVKTAKCVVAHPDAYYNFWYFRRDMARNTIFPTDSLWRWYRAFPAEFRSTGEGATIETLLNARTALKIGGTAPALSGTDLNGRPITAAKGKYVLLNFWATWCAPCREEIPFLKNIVDHSDSNRLQMVSVALASTEEATRKYVAEHGMSWVNGYDQADILNAYASNHGIPQLYLIDPDGKIIYMRVNGTLDDTVDLGRLRKLLRSRTLLHEKGP